MVIGISHDRLDQSAGVQLPETTADGLRMVTFRHRGRQLVRHMAKERWRAALHEAGHALMHLVVTGQPAPFITPIHWRLDTDTGRVNAHAEIMYLPFSSAKETLCAVAGPVAESLERKDKPIKEMLSDMDWMGIIHEYVDECIDLVKAVYYPGGVLHQQLLNTAGEYLVLSRETTYHYNIML